MPCLTPSVLVSERQVVLESVELLLKCLELLARWCVVVSFGLAFAVWIMVLHAALSSGVCQSGSRREFVAVAASGLGEGRRLCIISHPTWNSAAL